MDLEFEQSLLTFQKKIESAPSKAKLKPNVSEQWISKLKEQLVQ